MTRRICDASDYPALLNPLQEILQAFVKEFAGNADQAGVGGLSRYPGSPLGLGSPGPTNT